MTTKTDYHLITELKSRYTPVQPSIVSAAEVKMIQETLELSSRNDIELQNARDMVVMLYGRWADAQRQKGNVPATMELMDAMSAITYVIDQEKINRGLPV